jgi:hypothetical protein
MRDASWRALSNEQTLSFMSLVSPSSGDALFVPPLRRRTPSPRRAQPQHTRPLPRPPSLPLPCFPALAPIRLFSSQPPCVRAVTSCCRRCRPCRSRASRSGTCRRSLGSLSSRASSSPLSSSRSSSTSSPSSPTPSERTRPTRRRSRSRSAARARTLSPGSRRSRGGRLRTRPTST